MKIMILGAAGQIGKMVTDNLLIQTDYELVLYGRSVTRRLASKASDRVTLVDGTFEEVEKIAQHLNDVDAIYLSFVAKDDLIRPLVKMIEASNVRRFIAASVPDLYEEISGPFQKWYRDNTGIMWTSPYRTSADIIENSTLDYVILRITWLYNQEGNTNLHITKKGEPFTESQVTRQAVAQFVVDLLTGKETYNRASLGLGEPNTAWEKPSFY